MSASTCPRGFGGVINGSWNRSHAGSTCEQLPSMLNVYSFTTDESLSSPTTPLFVTHDTSLPNPHAGTLQLAQCCAGRRGSTCHMMFSWCIYMIQTIYFEVFLADMSNYGFEFVFDA